MTPYKNRAVCLAMLCLCVIGGLLWYFLCADDPDPAAARKNVAVSYQEKRWEDLVPDSWHPEKIFEGLDVDTLSDDDPRVKKAFESFVAEWAKAPANEPLNGQRIKIPGFIAPLEWENDMELKEFLLVPYFGACIHQPPPPANQIIYIKLEKPLANLHSMDTVWVYGSIFVEKHDSGSMGAAVYKMQVDRIEPYQQQ